jgi:hypothetical protein
MKSQSLQKLGIVLIILPILLGGVLEIIWRGSVITFDSGREITEHHKGPVEVTVVTDFGVINRHVALPLLLCGLTGVICLLVASQRKMSPPPLPRP